MEKHLKLLDRTCRLCKNTIVLKRGYVTPKTCYDYADILRNFFGVLITEEDRTVYPVNLCNTCKKSLDKVRKSGNAGTLKTKQVIFAPHEDEDCELCFRQKGRQKNLNFKSIDAELKRCDFHKIDNRGRPERLYYRPQILDHGVSSGITLTIASDLTWKITVFTNEIENSQLLTNLPSIVNDDTISQFIEVLASCSICSGNRDFVDVLNKRVDFREPFLGADQQRSAYVESVKGGSRLVKEGFTIIRSVNCHYLVAGDDLCKECKKIRKNLSTYRLRGSESHGLERNTSVDSTTNIRYLSIEELQLRCKNLQLSRKKCIKEAASMAIRLSKIVEGDGLRVSSDNHEFFKNLLKECPTEFEEGSPQWLLWQQQLEQASKNDSKSMRWHPLIIRWCLSIYHTSPAAYRQIASKRNKFLCLPHVNTLKKYINFTEAKSGFNPDIVEKLIEDSNLAELSELQKNVSLIFDEIKIKSGLVFRRSTGKLVGFTEMGELNEELRVLQDNLDGSKSSDERDFAKYVNVFMVRGIFSNLCYPFGYHASTGFNADQLFPLVWDASAVLECIGFKVRVWVCDGATPNRKLFKINSAPNRDHEYYWTKNLFDPARKIYFLSDVPHLLKTTRNNFENSHGNRNSRNLHVDHQDISWEHLISVYEWDLGQNRAAFGLRKLPRLKEEHVNLTPQHRMKVKYAAQTLSQSVGNAMEMQGRHDTKSTIKFIKTFNKTFDCLNVMTTNSRGNMNKLPYKSKEDPRFEYLESILGYLDDWRAQADATVGMRKEEKDRLCLSHQTDFGWHLTIHSFIDLSKELFDEGADFILSEKFSQDPLEEQFSAHRRISGTNENPSLVQFAQQSIALNVIKSDLISDLRGNTKGKPDNRAPIDITDTRIPRKRKIDEH